MSNPDSTPVATIARPDLVRPGGYFGGTPGPGRKPGGKNRVTQEQQDFAEMVIGKYGSPEFKAFIAVVRAQIMSGTCPPPIMTLILHYRFGKPADRIEVAEAQKDVGDLSQDVLRGRALRIVERELSLRAKHDAENTIDVTPVADEG